MCRHPAILYDNVTDLYWMASNMNRDSTRVWRCGSILL